MSSTLGEMHKVGGYPGGAGVRGEGTRSGTEKRCSHNLQSGHPAWWSAGNWCFSHSKYPGKYFDRSEK